MDKKIIIDLSKFRACAGQSCDAVQPAGVVHAFPDSKALKTIRELAVFHFTCRRCKDAPCIEVCPCGALEKDENGMPVRSINLCIACKSCVTICPFGTMMTDFFPFKREWDKYLDLEDEKELKLFMENSPEGAVQLAGEEEVKQKNVFELGKNIYVKEHTWENLKMAE